MKKTENILGRLIGVTWRSMRKQLAQNISHTEYDISAEQGIIIAMLSHYEKVNQQMLTEFLQCEKTAITRWVDYLESMQLLNRVADKKDRRQNILILTPKGIQFASEFIEIGLLTETQALQGINKEDAKICKAVLKQIIKNLEITKEHRGNHE